MNGAFGHINTQKVPSIPIDDCEHARDQSFSMRLGWHLGKKVRIESCISSG